MGFHSTATRIVFLFLNHSFHVRQKLCNPIQAVFLHLLCLSKAALHTRSRQIKVRTRHVADTCLKVLLQVLRVRAVAMAWEETHRHLLRCWDEWLEQNVGTSPQGWSFSKRQALVRCVASATLFCWALQETHL